MIQRYTVCIFLSFFLLSTIAHAEENVDIEQQKITLYKQIEAITLIPWHYLAALNRYEANIAEDPAEDALIHINIPKEKWYGAAPVDEPIDEETILLFGGIGKDGDGDGIADRNNQYDILYTIANYLQQYGSTPQDIRTGLWNYYKRELTVLSIMNYARLFDTYQKIDLDETAFPIPKGYNYSYRNTWGDARGFGGRRIHEGTDIFANYGTPVRATTYGIIELKGWNKYGGWRIGIRDIYNRYHYYAHLNGFADGLEIGDIVEAGQTIGSVGASGYGPPGTSGKFPPHLHYGLYKDNGKTEWSFDPFPNLKRWERKNP
ncbi:M23 family metallopeptidase [Gracilibacillus caseinilyticus]|uniref:M23 family metallopeptidase n=1 Tax=Gracilibacillus caseinilyticus TaxID=2932256 RepID=A0ABY4EWC6_9BACI|nr:M23 family metallopeptidase [Gracilibacillus caseinilyticus]UOQ48162.1 M23 family metallopeptidase [Gracilibacillus caseinilyticus]